MVLYAIESSSSGTVSDGELSIIFSATNYDGSGCSLTSLSEEEQNDSCEEVLSFYCLRHLTGALN